MRCLAAGLITLAVVTGSAMEAQARDYRYCLSSPGYGYPGDCSYSSYAQCMASASGRLAGCVINPRAASYPQTRYRDQRRYRKPRWN